MSAIVDIVGREVLDSRGNPTVECDVLLEELAGSKEKRHEKRYEAIGRALDKYDEHLAEGKV